MIYILILVMTITNAFAAFFFKKSTGGKGVISIVKSKFLYIGGILYVLSAGFCILAYRMLPYSVVVPMGAINYIWTMLIAKKYLNEKINRKKVCGVILIMCGVVFVSL